MPQLLAVYVKYAHVQNSKKFSDRQKKTIKSGRKMVRDDDDGKERT